MSNAIIEIKGELSVVGWAVPEDLTLDEWYNAGQSIVKANKMISWIIGDWINAGEAKWGNKYDEAIKITGLSYVRLQEIASTAKLCKLPERSGNLSFYHHQQVTSFNPERQRYWLDLAEQNKWSARQLQDAIKEAETPKIPCPDCGEIFDQKVWHCPDCNCHWLLSQENCPNCYEPPSLPIEDGQLTEAEENLVNRLKEAIASVEGRINNGDGATSVPEPSYDELMDEAKETIENMKESEVQSGFASPEDIGPYSLIFTAKDAIEAGLKINDLGKIAEGLVMLQQAIGNEAIKEAYRIEVKTYRESV